MSVPEQQCQNRCQYYPNSPEGPSGVLSGSSYSWTPHSTGETVSGGVLQRPCSGGGSASCSPVSMTFSPAGYYENQGMGVVQLQRKFGQAGEYCIGWF